LIGKPDAKRPLRRSKHRWKDNIKMKLKKIGLEGVELIHLTNTRDQWWALVNMVRNLWVP
jgi:hypothetical protein